MRLHILFLAALCLLTATAHAETPARNRVVDYDVYTGGLKMLKASMTLDDGSARNYRLLMNAQTDGLIKIFTDWKGTLESTGKWTADGDLSPLRHKSLAVWPKNVQTKEFAWNADGTLTDFRLTETEEGTNETLADINPALGEDSVDILSAALEIMQTVAKTGSCEHTEDVFDGKRRFTLSAVDQGVETLSANSYNKYSGPARKCAIHVIPGEGDWHEKLSGWMAFQDRAEKAGTEPVVWLAKLDENSPAVPVKVKAQTNFGTFFIHLAGIRPASAKP